MRFDVHMFASNPHASIVDVNVSNHVDYSWYVDSVDISHVTKDKRNFAINNNYLGSKHQIAYICILMFLS